MLSGETIDGRKAHEIGLVDRLAIGDPLTDATRWAGELVKAARTSKFPAPKDRNSAAAARENRLKRSNLSPEPPFIVDCVEAAAGAPVDGDASETRPVNLLASDAAGGLLHAFLRQRRIARIPGFADGLAQPDIVSIAVVGAGRMGAGIATILLNASLPVTLIDPNAETLAAGGKHIALTVDRDVATGRLDPDAAMARLSLLSLGGGLEAAADADLAIEAGLEDIDVRRDLFRTLDRMAKPGAILASNSAAPTLMRSPMSRRGPTMSSASISSAPTLRCACSKSCGGSGLRLKYSARRCILPSGSTS